MNDGKFNLTQPIPAQFEFCLLPSSVRMIRPATLSSTIRTDRVNPSTDIAVFTLSLDEDRPGDADFVRIHASVQCRGFCGRTAFEIARRDIRRFVEEAQQIRSNDRNDALMLGGWDHPHQRLRLQVARAGRSEDFVSRIQIAATGPRTDQWNTVDTEFRVPAAVLTSFLADLAHLASDHAADSASLTGDADAIA